MTIQELLTLTNQMYANVATDAVKVGYMNMAQRQLSPFFDVLVADTFTTTALNDEYPLPEDCEDVADIVTLGVSKTDNPVDRYDYTPYFKSTFADYPKIKRRYFQIRNTEGEKKLVLYPVPTESDLVVSVYYNRRLADLSTSVFTGSPEFDPRYHDLLAMWCCHMLASSGAIPDTDQSDMFMQKWQSGILNLRKIKLEMQSRNPSRRRDNPHWNGAKTHVSGSVVQES